MARATINRCLAMLAKAVTMSAVVGMSAPALGQLHAGDIVLQVQSGRVVTGRSAGGSAGGLNVLPTRVFVNSFGAQGVENFTTDPGFNTVPNQFPGSQLFGISVEGPARRWTPAASGAAGQGSSCTVPAETISVFRSATGFVSTTGGPQGTATNPPPPGLAIGLTASGTGFVHTHPTYAINPGMPGQSIADGVYLVQMRAWVGVPIGGAVAPSEPLFLLLGQNAPGVELDAARVWLEGRLAAGASGDAVLCPPMTPACAADFNADGTANIDDIFIFLNAWFAGDPRADQNGNGVDIDDIFVFLNTWFRGC